MKKSTRRARLRAARHKRRLTQRELATRAKCGLRTVERAEAGAAITYPRALRIARELGVGVELLLGDL